MDTDVFSLRNRQQHLRIFASNAIEREETGLIAAVGVDESAKCKGVGLALMVKAMENMRERGIEGVFIDSVVIRGFYKRLGFETCWEYEGFVW